VDTDFDANILDFMATKSRPGVAEGLTAASLLIPIGPDSEMSYNLLWRLSEASLVSIKVAARNSLIALQAGGEGAFNTVFMTRRNFFLDYNVYFHFPIPSLPSHISKYVITHN
jgi:hypothetical protein